MFNIGDRVRIVGNTAVDKEHDWINHDMFIDLEGTVIQINTHPFDTTPILIRFEAGEYSFSEQDLELLAGEDTQ